MKNQAHTAQVSNQVPELVDSFFRHESGKVISHLTRKFGSENIELVEDAVQEALFKAMKTWPYSNVPDNPSAWVLRVASNKLLDVLRREKNFSEKVEVIKREGATSEGQMDQIKLDEELEDDLLKMMFACCHSSLSVESQIILTLKILCGFGKAEIATALLKSEDAVAKAYTRGKEKIKAAGKRIKIPGESKLNERLDTVLKIIYLLFNEGYKASQGENLLRRDLCNEAIRLTDVILRNPKLARPKPHALMALMCFHASRFDARISRDGELLTIQEQDRSQWDQDLIERGRFHITQSAEWSELSAYHIQASIAYCHCIAKSYEETDWDRILTLYDAHMAIDPSEVAALNRLVAYAKVHGANKALAELTSSGIEDKLGKYYLLYAIKSDLLSEIDELELAKSNLDKAIEMSQNEAERTYMLKKRDLLEAG